MKKHLAVLIFMASLPAFAIQPFYLPWMNSTTGAKEYHSTDHPNSVFVIHAFWEGCEWCHTWEPKVNQIAEEYASNPRLQVLDVGIDKPDEAYSKWISAEKP